MLNRAINRKTQQGFSLVEMMVAMTVGAIILAGVFTLHFTTRRVQDVNEMQMDMVSDARFVMEMLAFDLRHVGMWGGTNMDGVIECRLGDPACPVNVKQAVNDCVGSRYNNLSQPVFGTDGNAIGRYGSCIPASESRQAGTDILEIRYADSNPVAAGDFIQDMIYIRSNFVSGRVFDSSGGQPTINAYDASPLTQNYKLQSFVYYVSDYTDAPGDGIPSLRRVALVPGPKMENQTLISGVVNFQVQFGEDVVPDQNGKEWIDVYVDGDAVTDWAKVFSAKIWLVLRSDEKQLGVNTKKTFNIAGQAVEYGGQDDYRYFLVTSVVNLRNVRKI